MLGALSLAQVYVDTEKPNEAITVLEDADAGPLTLTRADHPADEPTDAAIRRLVESLLAPPPDASA